jgi:hypothetical protein
LTFAGLGRLYTQTEEGFMTTIRRPTSILVALPLLVTGCTFGTLKAQECLRLYSPGLTAAAERARSRPVRQESYSFCVDGRARAQALHAALQANGFTADGPAKHFEVPGGWCLSGTRHTSAELFHPTRSLHAMCALGHSSRAYMTGGTLTRADGEIYYVRSIYERGAEERREGRRSK